MPKLTAVLKQLRKQQHHLTSNLERVEEAIAALSGVDGSVRRKGRARNMSAAGRARIVAAQRARWAKWKRQKKAA